MNLEQESQLVVTFRDTALQLVQETAYTWNDLYETLEDLELENPEEEE